MSLARFGRGTSVGAVMAAAAWLGTTACSDGTAPADTGGSLLFSQEITLPELEQRLLDGPTRVEIELARDFFPDRVVAREVEIETPDELNDDEEIEARIADIAVTNGEGTLFLEIPGLTVTFDDVTTRFRSENGSDLTFDEFVTRVESALAMDRMPAVEAERDPPAEPQPPEDATFFALKLELDDEADGPEIEMTIDDRHLIMGATSSPDAIIAILGIEIELLVSDGITELEAENDDLRDEDEFEGIVKTVSISDRTVTLMDGTVIHVPNDLIIKRESGDDDQLTTLSAVDEAVGLGLMVEADGEGVPDPADPNRITAVDVEFEIEDDIDDMPGVVEFETLVKPESVNLGAQTFELMNGTLVRIVDGFTDVKRSGDDKVLESLDEVAAALDAGLSVEADGDGLIESTDPLVLIAIEVEFKIQS